MAIRFRRHPRKKTHLGRGQLCLLGSLGRFTASEFMLSTSGDLDDLRWLKGHKLVRRFPTTGRYTLTAKGKNMADKACRR